MGAFKELEIEQADQVEAKATDSAKLDKILDEFAQLERNRKFSGVFRIASAIRDFENRIGPFIDPIKIEIDWAKVEQKLEGPHEQVALHWMKAFWAGHLPSESNALSVLWKTDCKIKEAIVCALAETTFASYVLHERFRMPKAAWEFPRK